MIRKLKSGKYRLYSRKKNPKTGKRRNLGTFDTREAAAKHERAVQFFKRGGYATPTKPTTLPFNSSYRDRNRQLLRVLPHET